MSGFDLTSTIVPNSTQLNAEDLLTGPRTEAITMVFFDRSGPKFITLSKESFSAFLENGRQVLSPIIVAKNLDGIKENGH